ncbi:hypothetical protein [Streptomyces sp. SD15]
MNVNDTTSAAVLEQLRHRPADRRRIDADLPALRSEVHASREYVLNIPAA